MRPVIVGAGAAGLMAALALAPRKPILLCGAALGVETASGWAQGGIAAAVGDDDSWELHAQDTIAAGAGLCDETAVSRIVQQGPRLIEKLLALGAAFEAGAGGVLELGLEAAHARRRIVHAKDATGAEVMRVLVRAVRAEQNITVRPRTRENHVQGVRAMTPSGIVDFDACLVVLATGGVGGLFAQTTNPIGAVGAGLALAARAGAQLRDLEFVQFHPTALDCGGDPMPLISEALRGEGAVLVDERGEALTQGGDLAPRDVVARAVAAKYAAGGRVFLDARRLDAAKFPAVFALCRARKIDPAKNQIPVRPAAHYHMGGVAVDASGESSVRGLFACGEVASSGLHGANRLASNSLLEAMVMGAEAAEAILGRTEKRTAGVTSSAPPRDLAATPEIRKICSQRLGILRDGAGLREAVDILRPASFRSDAALVAWLIAQSALRRQESRGAHFRTDFPATSAIAESSRMTLGDAMDVELAA
jgi:L-aspartate oxidase